MNARLAITRLSPAWLWLLVAAQVAIPASYYWVREDRDDERFAWRMFSTVRLQRCEVAAHEVGRDGVFQSVDLSRALHASWIRSLERGRARVIEAFLSKRCAQPGRIEAVLDRHCKSATGEALPALTYRVDCSTGQFGEVR